MNEAQDKVRRGRRFRTLLPIGLALLTMLAASLAVAAEPSWVAEPGVAPQVTIPEPTDYSISGLVFHDLNRDGDWQEGEPGIGGVEVTLDPGGLVYVTNETDEPIGGYWFGGIVPGEQYTVTCAAVPGYVPTSPSQVTGIVINDGGGGTIPGRGTIPSGQKYAVVHFGQRGAYTQRLIYIARNSAW